MFKSRWACLGLASALAAGLGGCGYTPPPSAPETGGSSVIHDNWSKATGSAMTDSSVEENFKFGAGGFSTGSGGGILGGGGGSSNGGSNLAVNAYLWRGTLETLKFMPLTSADPFGGVIITDWWTPPASPNERFKAAAYILTKDLRSDGVHITLFRQVQQGSTWIDAPVDPTKATELENMVLARARELRTLTTS